MILFDYVDETRMQGVAGADNRQPAGEREHPARQRVALHRDPALGETHCEPARDPARAMYQALLVGGQRLQCRVGQEQRGGACDQSWHQHAVAIHEDDEIGGREAAALDGAQRRADGVSLAGIPLTRNNQVEVEVRRLSLDQRGDRLLVRFFTGTKPDRCRQAGASHLIENGSDARARGARPLAEGDHHEVQPAGPFPRPPLFFGCRAEPGKHHAAVDQGTREMRPPPAKAPQAGQPNREHRPLADIVPKPARRRQHPSHDERQVGCETEHHPQIPFLAETGPAQEARQILLHGPRSHDVAPGLAASGPNPGSSPCQRRRKDRTTGVPTSTACSAAAASPPSNCSITRAVRSRSVSR